MDFRTQGKAGVKFERINNGSRKSFSMWERWICGVMNGFI